MTNRIDTPGLHNVRTVVHSTEYLFVRNLVTPVDGNFIRLEDYSDLILLDSTDKPMRSDMYKLIKALCHGLSMMRLDGSADTYDGVELLDSLKFHIGELIKNKYCKRRHLYNDAVKAFNIEMPNSNMCQVHCKIEETVTKNMTIMIILFDYPVALQDFIVKNLKNYFLAMRINYYFIESHPVASP